jgi:hypothetical protein
MKLPAQALLKHMTVNLIRLDPIPRKGGIKVRRLIAANPISIAHTCSAWMCSGKLCSCDCPAGIDRSPQTLAVYGKLFERRQRLANPGSKSGLERFWIEQPEDACKRVGRRYAVFQSQELSQPGFFDMCPVGSEQL